MGKGWTVGQFQGNWYLVSPHGFVIGEPMKSRKGAERRAKEQNEYDAKRAANSKQEERDKAEKRHIYEFFKKWGPGV